jgi:peroxiredoxin Q/BCP
MAVTIGKPAPAFTLPDQAGVNHSLEAFAGQWVVLFFYPKDMTPGCTIETKAFADRLPEFQKRQAAVVGISADSSKSHARFGKLCGATFPLLSDNDRTVIRKYGVWKKKTLFGKTGYGIARDSFLIDPSGVVVKRYARVTPKDHADEVLADLDEFRKR